jgi:hypothetical protein
MQASQRDSLQAEKACINSKRQKLIVIARRLKADKAITSNVRDRLRNFIQDYKMGLLHSVRNDTHKQYLT